MITLLPPGLSHAGTAFCHLGLRAVGEHAQHPQCNQDGTKHLCRGDQHIHHITQQRICRREPPCHDSIQNKGEKDTTENRASCYGEAYRRSRTPPVQRRNHEAGQQDSSKRTGDGRHDLGEGHRKSQHHLVLREPEPSQPQHQSHAEATNGPSGPHPSCVFHVFSGLPQMSECICIATV